MYPQTFGKYVLEKELAVGGMARVLLATLRGAGGFEKRLVVKQIRDELAVDHEFVQRFVEEAKTTVALSHPNIVPVYELGIEMGTYYLAMELVDGVSVDQLLVRSESGAKIGLSPEEGAYIGVEVCRALDYAHRRMQVVHRDITPRNVMVDEEGQVKIIDFGIAARASVAGQDVFGTPGHMPPEQLRREEIGPPTDIFAVAVLLMELWSGAPPFRRKTPAESLAQMHAPHPKTSRIDPRLAPLEAIMTSAMALAKADRPQQADDLGRALRKFLSDTDLGDVERKLGERVREARKAAVAAAAKKRARSADSLFKPSKPSMPDMGPRTFAVRAEVGEWKPEAGGTRRLPPSEHPPPDFDPPKMETIATRPLETPIVPPPSVGFARKRAGVRIALATGLLVPLVVWGAVKASGTRGNTDAPGRLTATANPTTNPTSTTTSNPTPISNPTAAPNSTATATPISNPTPAVDSANDRVKPAGGQLFLIGDPGTQVAVDNAPFRPCPIAIYVKAGPHQVRFAFGYETAHDTVGQQVTVASGEHVTMRADFTAAVPRIRIEH
jgi:serine/threonine-protein kinase